MSDLHKRNLAVPFFTQRDNTYIWQQLDEDDTPFGPKYPMAWRSCNITSLCMILHYWGLTTETHNINFVGEFVLKEVNFLSKKC